VRTLIAFFALSSAAAAQVTVTGTVFYEDRAYTGSGFTGALVNRPVRQAEIDLVNSAGDVILASGVTDETGAYSLTFAGPDQDVRIRVYARRVDLPPKPNPFKINAVVMNNHGAKLVYTVLGAVFNSASPPGDLIITRSGGAGGAFNIFDCAVKSFQYITSTPIEPGLTTPPLLTIYWQAGSANGTYFDGSVPAIFLLGKDSDPDEYDDDIILHEIGHWVTVNFSRDDTPGGPHSITDQRDARLAWSEGFAHYWSAIVRQYANDHLAIEYAAPALQVDNFVNSNGQPINGVFDVEGPSFASSAVTAKNELAVAAVLWDLVDPAVEAFDGVSGQETPVWKSVHEQIPNRVEITIEDFHEGLAALGTVDMTQVSGSPADVRIFNSREIRYYADPSEPNADPLTAPSLSGLITLRTFYTNGSPGDQDWFTVVAGGGKLVIETLNLKDGADTMLELYDATGVTLLASNDNRAGGSDKSSRLTRSVKSTTTFRVKVAQVDQVSEFGTYDLLVQTSSKKGDGDGGCGLTGVEGLLLLALLRRRRRR
jgi:hypothetical protein